MNLSSASTNGRGSSATTTSGGTTASHGSAAIIIPSSTPSVPLPSPSHHYSASLPAYPPVHPSSLPPSLSGSSGWFSQAGLAFLPSLRNNSLGPVPEKPPADPITGWRPSQIVMPASAPPTTGSTGPPKSSTGTGKASKAEVAGTTPKTKKTQAQQSLEDVQEEEADEKPS